MKQCSECGLAFPATSEFFHKHQPSKDGLHRSCKPCRRAAMNAWYAGHPGKNSENVRNWRKKYPGRRATSDKAGRQRLKREVFEAYGGAKCFCCSEEHIEFLSLDHVNGGGNQERRAQGHRGGQSFYETLKRQDFPDKDKYRVACMNCNFALGHAGYCPHQQAVPQAA